MLIVTHNIEEAVLLADRIFVLSANPGRIRTEIPVDLNRPRDRRSDSFQALVDEIYAIMTGRDEAVRAPAKTASAIDSPTEVPLPAATVGGMAGLLEIVAGLGGREDLPDLARALTFEVDDLLPVVDAVVMLGLARYVDADMELTDAGQTFAAADILTSKQIFGAHAKERAPLVRAIHHCLSSTDDGTRGEDFFLDILRRGFSEDQARHQLDIAIDWVRYGELFDHDANTGQLTREAQPEHIAQVIG